MREDEHLHDHEADHRETHLRAAEDAPEAAAGARIGDAAGACDDQVPLAAEAQGKGEQIATYRPVLQTVARMIATDRRAVVLATEKADILLANSLAGRLGFRADTFGATLAEAGLDWPEFCTRAQRAGSVRVALTVAGAELEGELVHLPLGQAEGFLLRLSESDQEATWLRNRARAANLMRVAHDMRTPIQALLVAAERILDGQEAQGAPHAAHAAQTGEAAPSPSALRQQLKRAAEVALDQISNVLGVIRGEQSISGLRPDENFNLSTEVHGLQEMVAPIAAARGARVMLSISPEEEIWVHGPVRFVRALCQNMVDNSVKYGGELVEIRVSCEPLAPTMEGLTSSSDEPDQGPRPALRPTAPAYAITIEVLDQGGGLPEEQKERLRAALGPSAVIAPSSGAQQPSAGNPAGARSAGLDVLAHALRQLGGKLEVQDRLGQGAGLTAAVAGSPVIGTCLRATFPLLRGIPRAREEAVETAPLRAPSGAPCLSGIGVLVVEDSPASRDWLVHMLRAAGAQVLAAENGIEALAILRTAKTAQMLDLMLSDMTLPFMSGVELARRIRAEQATGAILWNGALVALTAHVDPAIDAACHAAGMAKVLEKPILPAQLCREIFELVEAARARKATGGKGEAARGEAARGEAARGAGALGAGASFTAPIAQRTGASSAVAAPAAQTEKLESGATARAALPRGRPARKSPAAAATPQRPSAFAPLMPRVVEDLMAQLGASGAKRFMHRARTEADSVLQDIRRDGITADTGRMIHAATGAAGLTGLKRVERGLRTLETALADPSLDLSALLSELEFAVGEATQLIETIDNE